MPGNLRYNGASVSQKPPHGMSSRTMSLDSLHDRKAVNLDNKVQEYLTTRVSKTTPKANDAAMQFVKTGPAGLYKNAMVQIKKAEKVKELRKNMEEEVVDWKENLDKWKSSRRKRNEEALGRVIEIKKNEQEEELSKTRRKSKTFSEIQGDKTKRGRRYNLVVHDDDNNDLAGLGLSGAAQKGPDDMIDQDNKDAKSDAGFCTGSDTGSDGVFAEDNISDTSSALGDKKEAHDSLLDTGMRQDEELHINGHASTSLTSSTLITEEFTSTTTTTSRTMANIHTDEYTYDKAIAGYKQYAENSAKKRTSSITSLNSNTSYTKEEDKKNEKFGVTNRSPSPNKSKKLEGMVNFFTKEVESDTKTSPEPRVTMREKSPKVDVGKRRSMFESRDPSVEFDQKQGNRRSLDMSNSLKNRVASFENLDTDTTSALRVRATTPSRDANLRKKVASFERLDTDTTKYRGVTPPKDSSFQEKLASFATSEAEPQQVKKKTPERDANFYKKLASFTSMEEDRESVERSKTLPQGDPSLRSKIASYEKLEQETEVRTPSVPKHEPIHRRERKEETMQYKDRSVSLENLDEPLSERKLRPSYSMGSILRCTPSTPYMEVDLQESEPERQCEAEVTPAVSFQPDPDSKGNSLRDDKRSTVYEIVEKCQLTRDVESAPMYSIFQYLSPEVIKDYDVVDEDFGDHLDNIYENITDEPLYENIYEKVDDQDLRGDTVDDHHYQTLEEVREEAADHARPPPSPPSPMSSSPLSPPVKESPPPPKRSPLVAPSPSPLPKVQPSPMLTPAVPAIPEVLDVTWTDSGLSSLAAPPSEPPPPPPPDDDDDSDSCDLPSLPEQQQHEEDEDGFTRENSTRRLKKELNRRRSDFLGTSSQHIEEEPTVKPPPALADLLRQEREAERNMIGGRSPTQQVLMEAEIARREREIIENLERSEQLKQQEHQTDQIYMVAVGEGNGGAVDNSDMEEHLQYQEKLAELEEEMLRHDKDMLRRVGHLPSTPSSVPPEPSTHQHLPIQEFYTAPAYESTPPASLNEGGFIRVEEQGGYRMEEQGIIGYRTEDQITNTPSPSQYTSLASPHPFSRSNSQSAMDTSPSPHAPLQAARSSPASGPEPLPRRRKVPPPAPAKANRTSDLNTAERREAMRVSRMTSNDQRSELVDSQEQTSTSGQQMTKQTLLALSAIPKPKLTENESWITKKKAEAQKRDYSKHWLLQEAEQRRLEQQDRISRQKFTTGVQQQPPSPQTTSPYISSPSHNTISSTKQPSSHLQNTSIYPPQTTTPVFSSYPQALKSPSPVHSNSNNVVSNNNTNSWRNQATTYQPHIPAPAPTSDKALPDSIIHNLTQRVNNKNKSTFNNSGGRLSSNSNSSSSYSNHRDDNYHDYMNADALSSSTASPAGHSPLYQGPGQASPPIPQPQDPSSSPQDQRLLSVSGKKKCSHCSEELGRGAAMIIESLRLFYHIPCFKCCVCGIQLGNGSAGADVRVRNHKLHCHNCYSNDEGMKFSKV